MIKDSSIGRNCRSQVRDTLCEAWGPIHSVSRRLQERSPAFDPQPRKAGFQPGLTVASEILDLSCEITTAFPEVDGGRPTATPDEP